MSESDFNYEVVLQEDPLTGETILPIPAELMTAMGWSEGDDLDVSVNEEGQWIIKKV